MQEHDHRPLTDLAFTSSVKTIQARLGSRERMQRLESSGRWRAEIDDNLASFVALRTSIYLGTASASGRPYIQHRGGPTGFITMPDRRHLEFPDYPGNQQYITLGNLSENPQAFIFMMDYFTRTRIKFWGRAKLRNTNGPDRAISFAIEAWDVNCNQHIPELVAIETVREVLPELERRNAALEEELAVLRAAAPNTNLV